MNAFKAAVRDRFQDLDPQQADELAESIAELERAPLTPTVDALAQLIRVAGAGTPHRR